MPSLSAEPMRRLVAEARVGRLATVAADSRPHLVPVCFVLEPGAGHADRVHIAVDFKPKRTTELRRTANLRATGRASLLVDHYGEDWSRLWWVRLDGTGQPLDGTEHADEIERALDALAAKYPQYRAQRPDGPVLRIEVEAWRGWSAEPLS